MAATERASKRVDRPLLLAMKKTTLAGALFTALLALLFLQGFFSPMPTIAITFDAFNTTYTNAYPIMKEHGLVGTFYIDPDYLERKDVVDELLPMVTTTDQLREMQSSGWSIQGYTGQNMVRYLESEGPDITQKKLSGMKNIMAAKGFQITSIAAGGRAWNQKLRDMTVGMYSSVRVSANIGKWQDYPVPDPLWILDGGTTGLGHEDTPERLGQQIDSLIDSKGLWIAVAHKVGEDGEPVLSISKDHFSAFCERLANEKRSYRLRVVRIDEATTPVIKAKYVYLDIYRRIASFVGVAKNSDDRL